MTLYFVVVSSRVALTRRPASYRRCLHGPLRPYGPQRCRRRRAIFPDGRLLALVGFEFRGRSRTSRTRRGRGDGIGRRRGLYRGIASGTVGLATAAMIMQRRRLITEPARSVAGAVFIGPALVQPRAFAEGGGFFSAADAVPPWFTDGCAGAPEPVAARNA